MKQLLVTDWREVKVNGKRYQVQYYMNPEKPLEGVGVRVRTEDGKVLKRIPYALAFDLVMHKPGIDEFHYEDQNDTRVSN